MLQHVKGWIVAAVFLAISASFSSSHTVYAQSAIPSMPQIPQIQQVELTDETARNAIDSYLTLKEEFADENMPNFDPNTPAAAYQGMSNYQQMQGVISQYGFSDFQDWYKSVTSVILAQAFLTEGNMSEYEESLAQLQNNPNIPEATKAQLLAMLQGMKPSDNNIAVVQTLMNDAEYGPKIEKARE